jgi:hypothetical protein
MAYIKKESNRVYVQKGMVFNKLTVLNLSDKKNPSSNHKLWDCLCDCGNLVTVRGTNLITSRKISCGRCPTNTFHKHKDGYMVGVIASGKEFYFDKTDIEFVTSHNWNEDSKGYISTTIGELKNKKVQRLHRLLIVEHDYLDHVNMNKKDNRRSNLRGCSKQQNSFNRPSVKGTSKYKGVSYSKKLSKWAAQIMYDGKQYHLGYSDNEEECAVMYDNKAKELFGMFARLNIVKEGA